jgi:HAD superfamily hydrolase (TIGR01549 family)
MTGPRAAVLFDLDGTLVDTMDAVPAAYVRTIREICGRDVTPDEVVEVWHIGPTPVVLEHFAGRPVADTDIAAYYRHFEEVVPGVRAFAGIRAMLEDLATDVVLGIVTTATRRSAEPMVRAAGLDDLVGVTVAGDEVERTKPHPDALLQAFALVGVAPPLTAYVGDRPSDLVCAEAAGAVPVHAAWSGHHVAAAHVAARPGDVRQVVEGAMRR